MIGSRIFSILVHYKVSTEQINTNNLFIACICLLMPYFAVDNFSILLSFLAFEVCCGIWFPAIGTLRGQYIPERTRATIMNFFRVPLNFLVAVVLLEISNIDNSTVFAICGLWLFLSFMLATVFRFITLGRNVINIKLK